MIELPNDVTAYKITPVFDCESVPKGLLKDHNTAVGVWAKIHILQGELEYYLSDDVETMHLLTVDNYGVSAPQCKHFIKPREGVKFYLEFYR